MMTYQEVKNYLYSLKHRGAVYGIDRMKLFTEAMGFPHTHYPVIHVAGTNGKGSICAMLDSIFREAGYRTGLFTSPHLVHQGERVQVNREILSHDAIIEYTRRLKPAAEAIEAEFPGHHPTFFEFMTGMAFLRFSEAQVDVGIFETGLGGRLDATNVVNPEIAIITSVSLDHVDILGETLEDIAAEKAGIIKPGKPVVLGFLPPEAESVICRRAEELGCPVYCAKNYFGEGNQAFPRTSLPGEYQQRNAATAALAARVLANRFHLTQDHIDAGLARVDWPGRWDSHQMSDRRIILDTTHNPEGAVQLRINLEKFVSENGYKPVILCGTLGTYRARALMSVVAEFARELVLLKPKQPRACGFEELRAAIPGHFEGIVRNSNVRACFPSPGMAQAGDPGEILVATGSIYLIGEIMEALYHEIPVGEESLQD